MKRLRMAAAASSLAPLVLAACGGHSASPDPKRPLPAAAPILDRVLRTEARLGGAHAVGQSNFAMLIKTHGGYRTLTTVEKFEGTGSTAMPERGNFTQKIVTDFKGATHKETLYYRTRGHKLAELVRGVPGWRCGRGTPDRIAAGHVLPHHQTRLLSKIPLWTPTWFGLTFVPVDQVHVTGSGMFQGAHVWKMVFTQKENSGGLKGVQHRTLLVDKRRFVVLKIALRATVLYKGASLHETNSLTLDHYGKHVTVLLPRACRKVR